MPGTDESDTGLGRARDLFLAALQQPEGERAAFLDVECAGDGGLRSEVDSLLASYNRAGGFLEGSAGDPAAAFWIGRSVGEYEILALIGRGGMGLVFEARQERPRRTVALKLLRPELADEGMRRRFEGEAELLGMLKHEGIARIFGAGTVETELGPQSYLAMERIEGKALRDFVESEGLGVVAIVRLFLRVCAAVQHAHDRGVIHRDLKPGNVLVEDSGQPKVLDFGVARAVNADLEVESRRTEAGQLVGTMAYMSPEQLRGESDKLSVQTDVYSLGVILYQLLAGVLPLDVRGKSFPEAIRILGDRDPIPLAETAPEVAPDLAAVVGKAIEREPERRYESVAQLAEDLRRFLSDEPVHARPPSMLYQFRLFARRNRVLVGGVLGIFLTLVAGVVLTISGQMRERALRREAQGLQRSAEEALERSRFEAYAANLAAAEGSLMALDVVNARMSLEQAEPRLRGWEWTHLRLRLDQSDPLLENGTGIESMALTRDATAVVTGGTDCSVRAFDLATRELLWTADLGQNFTVRGLAVAPTGGLVAAARGSWYAGRGGYGPIKLLSLADGNEVGELTGHRDVVQALSFSHSGTMLVSGSSDRTVRLWDLEGGREPRVLAEHGSDVSDVRFSDDGRWLASCGWDGRVFIFDSADWRVVQRFELDERLTCLAFSPDGEELAAGTWDGRLLLLDRRTGSSSYFEDRHHKSVKAVRFTADGRSVLSAGWDKLIQIHRLPRGTTDGVFLGATDPVTSLAIEDGGRRVLSGGLDGWVRGWRMETQGVRKLEPHDAWVYAVSASADGRTLASAGPAAKDTPGGSAYVKLHDLDSGEVRRRITVQGESTIWSLEFAPDADVFVTAGTRTGAIVWDAGTGEELLRLAHGDALRCATFDPAGKRIATTCHDLGVRVFDAKTGALLLLPMVWDRWRPYAACFSPDGTRLAVTYYGGAVALWDATDGSLLAGRVGQHRLDVYGVDFSPDGRVLVTSGRDHRIQPWSAARLLPLCAPIETSSSVLGVAFSPDGERLAVGDEAGLLRLFETRGWRQTIALHGHRSGIHGVEYGPTGRLLFTGGADGEVRVWDGGSAAEREVDRLFGKLQLTDDVLAAIASDPRLGEEERARAVELAKARRLDAEELASRAWRVALNPGLSPEDYAVAVRQASAALRERAGGDAMRVVLGAALYRAERFQEARAELEGAGAEARDNPFRCAFLTLTSIALGDHAAADREAAHLRELLDSGAWDSDAGLLKLLEELPSEE